MKKFSIFLLAAGMAAAAFTSCNKENDASDTPQFTKRVKSVTETRNSGTSTTTHYTYDNDNRLVKEVSDRKTITYTYTADTVTGIQQYDTQTPIVMKVAIENGKGVKTIIKTDNSTLVGTIVYDAQGHATKTDLKEGDVLSSSTTMTWTAGNKTSETSEYFGTDPSKETRTYTFGTDLNLVNFDPITSSIILEFLGMPSTNLPVSESQDNYPTSYTYTYEFDADKCPIKITTKRLGLDEPSETVYTLKY